MHANPNSIRSRVVLEIAAEMVTGEREFQQAKVMIRPPGKKEWPVCLHSSSTFEGFEAVMKREADLAMINPAAALTLALRGSAPFASPQPVRTIAVIPSHDQFVFAVTSDTGLKTFEDIAARRSPLRIGLRGQRDHFLQHMLAGVASAAGFRLDDIRDWGGELHYEGGGPPTPDERRFQALARGELNALFDEGAHSWIEAAIDAGLTILPLAEATVKKLEALGYRRGILAKSAFPRLPADVLTIDFSGWPIFVHAEASDRLVTKICAALNARKHLIPWQGDGPLPVERMCRDAPDTPIDVPLHPAAEKFWRECGYL